VRFEFHGADRDVTGSCHLFEAAGRRMLIDCGLFQGSRELDEDNAEPFGFEAGGIDFVLQTHAHLDHCGRLPLLVKRGFSGEIIATGATRELIDIVLQDAARIEEEDAARRNRWHGNGKRVFQPLYTREDAAAVQQRFGRVADYGAPIELAPGLRASFHEAGHILGSASVLLEFVERGRARSVLFSGDIGNRGRPILRDPAPPRADIVVMETTYGDRRHRSVEASVTELHAAVSATVQRGGNVVIPSFALERTQELLYFLRDGMAGGQLPRKLHVFVDSPMAASAIDVYRRHTDCFDDAARALMESGNGPFDMPGLRYTREREESMAINRIVGGAVIIAGSGMCTGGRVRHHLIHNLANPAAAVVFVGFAAAGTPARRIIDGARSIHLLGEEVPVRAHIHTINGFSAHADQAELLHWHAAAGGAERTILVHGEVSAMESFAQLLQVPVSMPAPGSSLEL
jgi:metallo-beta-lactamase family protein